MQNVTSQWSALFNAAHKTEYRFDIDGVSYLGKDVKDPPVISKPLLDVPAIGRVCTGSLKLTIYPKSQNIPKAATVDAYCRLSSADGGKVSEWIPQGKFYIYNRSGEKTLTLNCLDRMIKAGTTYIDKSGIHNWPAPMQTVVNEICRIMGVTLDARSVIKSGVPYYVDYPNEDTLISEVLSNIAAAHGGNWIMTEAGQLRLIPLASPASTAVQILGKTHRGYTAKGKAQTISRIILNDGAENEFVSGDETGLTISAKCEYATQAMANMLCSPFDCAIDNGVLRVTGATYDAAALDISSATAVSGALSVFSKSAMYGTVYEPYTIDGAYINPAVELGDTVEVTDRDNNVHRVVIQSITMNCTVACTYTLSAGTEGETEDEYPYITQQEITLSRTVKTNQTYFGNKINRSEGFVSELLVNDVVKARLVANATTFKMSACKDGEWVDGIYFDPVQGRYIITGDVIINGVVTFNDLEQSGSTIINGDNITTGTIKAERIDLSDYSTKNEIAAQIKEITNGLALSVENKDTSSTLTLTLDQIALSSAEIAFTGVVTFDDLKNEGSTVINGANITTGTIDASKVTVDNIDANNIKSGSISTNLIDLTDYATTDYVSATISSGFKQLSLSVTTTTQDDTTINDVTLSQNGVKLASTKISSTGISATRAASIAASAVNGITLNVTSEGTSATLTMLNGRTQIDSATITFTGLVTFNDLKSSGKTEISGDNITTGSIDASKIAVKNLQINNVLYGTYPVITCTGSYTNPVVAVGKDQASNSVRPTSLSLYGTTINVGDDTTTLYEVNISAGKIHLKTSSDTLGKINIGSANQYIVVDHSTATVMSIRPGSTQYSFSLGSSNYPWNNGYITMANISTASISTASISTANITTANVTSEYVTKTFAKTLFVYYASNVAASSTYGIYITANQIYSNYTTSSARSYIGTSSHYWDYGYIDNLYVKSSVQIGATNSKIGFFGATPVVRKSVSSASTSSTVTASSVATSLNALITALKGYGLIS